MLIIRAILEPLLIWLCFAVFTDISGYRYGGDWRCPKPKRLQSKLRKCYRKVIRHQSFFKKVPLYSGDEDQLKRLKKLCRLRKAGDGCVDRLRQNCGPQRSAEIAAGESLVVDMSDLCSPFSLDAYSVASGCMPKATIQEHDYCYNDIIIGKLSRRLISKAINEDDEEAKTKICQASADYIACVSGSLRSACGSSVLSLARKLTKTTLLIRIPKLGRTVYECSTKPAVIQIGLRRGVDKVKVTEENSNMPKTKTMSQEYYPQKQDDENNSAIRVEHIPIVLITCTVLLHMT